MPRSERIASSTPSAGCADQPETSSKSSRIVVGAGAEEAGRTPMVKVMAARVTRAETPLATRNGSTPLALDAAHHDALGVEALQCQEEDHDWEHGEHRARHHELGILDMLADQAGERHRQRESRIVAQDDQWPQEIVPHRQEVEGRD